MPSVTFGRPVPITAMPLQQLIDAYLERYVTVEHPDIADDFKGGLKVIAETPITHPTGDALRFGDWMLTDIVTDTVERYRETRRTLGTGIGGTNRLLSRLRAVFNWGIRVGYCDGTPFKRHTVTTIKLTREVPRSRRLNADIDEQAKLLAACDAHLRALVECTLETGMRRGEITNLRWRDVLGMTVSKQTITWAARSTILLGADRTKTRRHRTIPISTRLKGVLELRRFDPKGEPHALDTYVLGMRSGRRLSHRSAPGCVPC
jgi:integrase